MHQELSAAQRVVIKDIPLVVRTDMEILHKNLVILDARIAVLEIGAAGAQGFDFCALQRDAGLICFVYEVIMTGLAILADRLDACILSSH